jgi:hypothetical protein
MNNGIISLLKSEIIKRIVIGLMMMFISLFSSGQAGKLTGTVKDFHTKEGLEAAQVILIQNGAKIARTSTDSTGYFSISPIDPGNYSLKITYFDYKAVTIPEFKIESKTVDLDDIYISSTEIIITPKKKIISNEKSHDHDEILKYPTTNIIDIIAHDPGVQTFGNGRIAIKGDPTGIKYMLDGMSCGYLPLNIPKAGIDNFELIAGGVSADYGDFTAGIINITTLNPSASLKTRIEAMSSQFIDPFGYNLIDASITGPLIKKKNDPEQYILGFALTGSYTYNGVSNPPAIDLYRVKDNVLADIRNTPVRNSPLGQGIVSSASFVTSDQMTKTRMEANTALGTYTFVGKLNFQPSKDINVMMGGSMDHTSRNAFYYSYSMFNFDHNPQVIENNERVFLRFRQRFKNDDKALIQDAWYTFELSYTNNDQVVQDPRLKDNFFDYGYLGTFSRQFTPQYLYETHIVNGKSQSGYYQKLPTETRVTFVPGGINTDAENYTKEFFNLHGGSFNSFTQIQSLGGLLNGQSPSLVYSLWAAPGTNYFQYQKSKTEQYSLNASGTATVNKKHTLKFGIEYQQNVTRSYTVGGNFGTSIEDLWTRARQLLNSHLTQLDTAHPLLAYSHGNFTDTINYNWQEARSAQSVFDKNFRDYLISKGARDENGKLIDQQSIINLDQYKPSDLKLSYFSPDELLSNGHSYVNAYGYDYQGNKLTGKQSLQDFLDPMKRSEGAYNPIYMAGYIQDRFEVKNLHFNIGLRVDRFDANQKVLVDPYSMVPIKTAAEVNSISGTPVTHPGNIGQGYYVYVDDITNPTKITGYRNGSTWYNAEGAEIHDPKLIAEASRTGGIAPLLENSAQKTISTASFRDYIPQVNLLPRVSFSFPISDKASFYANYDVLSIRPSNNFGALEYYYFLDTRSTIVIPNPDLKPEKRTNYEIGFRQKIGNFSFLSVDAYYGEIRDRVQLVKYNYAYPVSYTTFGNVDFGTVKGISLGFDTWHTDNHPLSGVVFSANYTLQFADGTGSGSTSSAGLLAAGFPNLRTIYPLDYDTRNQFNASIDYRFGSGMDYTGPVNKKGSKWLSDAGLNLLFTAKSGNPYTAHANVTPQVEIGVSNRSTIAGTINGARMPWQFQTDLKADKNFHIRMGKAQNKEIVVNTYILVQNLFDAHNIINLYHATGLPNQDGYLQSAAGKSEAANATDQQAFIDQYNVKLNDPSNYVSPRFVRLGATVSF